MSGQNVTEIGFYIFNPCLQCCHISLLEINYARWTPVYLMDMMNLPDDIQEEFMSGKFAIKQTAGVFNGQWSDIATEKTVIKDLKGSGGIIGLTNQKSALLRWTFTRHILARFSSEMKTRSGLSSTKNTCAV